MPRSLPAEAFARTAFSHAFAAPAFVRAMLDFEAGLAAAQAAEGLLPAQSAGAIRDACQRLRPDVEVLVAEGRRSASLAVPLVRLLREAVGAEHAQHVHLGATSQDAIDTAMALCLKPCLEEADRALEGAVRALVARAREHRGTPMLGRTLLQPAVPITAGLKIARWAAALAQDRERLSEAQAAGLALQLGGPVGALEALGERGPAVRHRLALQLGLADVPAWHAHRNAWIDLLGRCAQGVLTCGKIARDLALLSQPEVGEMREAPPAQGGRSSAMPHKRNPVGCALALAAALRVPGLMATIHAAALSEHERALGGWQAEAATVPEIADTLGASLDFLDQVSGSLVIDPARMRANLDASGLGAPDPHIEVVVDEMLATLAAYA